MRVRPNNYTSEQQCTCLEGDGDDVEETSTVEATAGGGGCGGAGAVRLLIPPAAPETGTPLVEMTGTPVMNEIGMYNKFITYTTRLLVLPDRFFNLNLTEP